MFGHVVRVKEDRFVKTIWEVKVGEKELEADQEIHETQALQKHWQRKGFYGKIQAQEQGTNNFGETSPPLH